MVKDSVLCTTRSPKGKEDRLAQFQQSEDRACYVSGTVPAYWQGDWDSDSATPEHGTAQIGLLSLLAARHTTLVLYAAQGYSRVTLGLL